MKIKCVCFDWGGVILRHCRSWEEACGRAGVVYTLGDDSPAALAARTALNDAHQTGKIPPEEFYVGMSRALAGVYSAAQVRMVHDAYLLEEYAGVGPFLAELTRVPGVATALLSNTSPPHWERRLTDYRAILTIKHAHASHLLGFRKPGAAAFRAFEKATGFAAHDILFFDDLPENIAAAQKCGWHAELVDHSRETVPQLTASLRRHRVLAHAPAS